MNPDELNSQDQAGFPGKPAEGGDAEAAKLETPDDDKLAEKWGKKVASSRKHWEKLHKRIAHNRKLVAGFDWARDPTSNEFIDHRANMLFSTVQATLPNIYARNPDVSITGQWKNKDVRLFGETLEKVVSRQAKQAKLKRRAKLSVISSLVSYFGIVKVTYQRDIHEDPAIMERINDTQDNIVTLEGLIQRVQDPDARGDAELRREELEQTLKGLQEQSEVVAAEGITVDRVLPENLLIDESVCEFYDYEVADWLAQQIPMKRGAAEALYKVDLAKAVTYKTQANSAGPATPGSGTGVQASGAFGSSAGTIDAEDETICIIEIWDRQSQRIYTMADGCKFFCREPFSVERVGQRWYPFFILPYSVLDGQFVAPCLVDLTEKLQTEHNDTRDKFAAHRDLNKPGWIADSETDMKSIKRHTDSILGEVTIVDAQGRPLNQVIQPKQPIPINPIDYDTGAIRSDWEVVTGLQDAARSTIVQPKTATEANIAQQSLSGRTSEFRDKVEDWLSEIYEYMAQVLLQELSPAQVERYTGPNVMGEVPDPITGMPTEGITERTYEWPQLSRDQIFDMVEITIVPGTTGAPDKAQSQEMWIKVMPAIQPLITQIMSLSAQSVDVSPLEALLRETLKRFDDRIDADQFLPVKKPMPLPQIPGMPGMAAPGAQPGQMPDGAVPGMPGVPANDPTAAPTAALPGAPSQSPQIPQV